MTAQEVWDAFHDVYMMCPQSTPLDDPDTDTIDGFTVDELKADLGLCVQYWMSSKTTGGRTLWDTGWWIKLPQSYKNVIQEYNEAVTQAGVKVFGRHGSK